MNSLFISSSFEAFKDKQNELRRYKKELRDYRKYINKVIFLEYQVFSHSNSNDFSSNLGLVNLT